MKKWRWHVNRSHPGSTTVVFNEGGRYLTLSYHSGLMWHWMIRVYLFGHSLQVGWHR